MTIDSSIKDATQRELLRLALLNSKRSVPLALAAVAFVAWLGLESGQTAAAITTGVIGSIVGAWRIWISVRNEDVDTLSAKRVEKAQAELEGNAALAGLMWSVSTIGIYPGLTGTTATTYVAIIFGSIAVAAFFMTLVGRSFAILAGLQLGSLIAVSLFVSSSRSVALAFLAVIFGATCLRASRELNQTATRAIRHGLEADAANKSLQTAKESADAANVAKSQFLATMSHEIRTPMNGVLGALDLLRHSKLDGHQRLLVRTASSSGESLMGILNDVLDHSKIEAGKLTLVSAPMSLHAMASSVAGLFRANAEAKKVAVRLDIGEDVVDWVIGDAQRLKQVLLNLVGNAIKFTENGVVTLSLSARPDVQNRARVTFEVIDTGIGIAPDSLQTLFQPFHQIASSTTRRRGGTGLGLAISQRIVEALGGQIKAESSVGRGSRFHFTLSLERDTAPPPPPPLDSALGGLNDLGAPCGTILVVEDNPVNRIIAVEMLQSLGMDVIEAEDGEEALTQIAAHPVELILMDCQMPVMDGYTATERIREREALLSLPRTPIVALTANAFDEDAAHAKAVGMDAHLSKPYTRAQLRMVLRQWL